MGALQLAAPGNKITDGPAELPREERERKAILDLKVSKVIMVLMLIWPVLRFTAQHSAGHGRDKLEGGGEKRGAGLYTTLHYCSALHCTALHCTAQHYSALSRTTLHFTALHCTALHCTALYYYALHYSALH